MTILLVDDEKIILDVLTRELDWEALGVDRVLSAQSVRQAMEIFLHERVDILVCDIEMPRESGLDLLRELQQNQLETVSILLTAHSDFRYAREAVSLGAMEYITKPAPMDVLSMSIQRAVEKVNSMRRKDEWARDGRKWAANRRRRIQHFWQDVADERIASSAPEMKREWEVRCIDQPMQEKYDLIQMLLRVSKDDRSGMTEAELNECIREICREMLNAEAVVVPEKNAWLAILPASGAPIDQRTELARVLQETIEVHQQVMTTCCLMPKVAPEEIMIQGGRIHRWVHDRPSDEHVLVFHEKLPAPEWNARRQSFDRRAPFEQWRALLETRQVDNLCAKMATYLFSINEDRLVPKQALVEFLHDFLQIVYSVMADEGLRSEALYETDYLQELLSRATEGVNDLFMFCGEAVVRCTQLIVAAHNEDSISEQIRRYVSANLGQDLSRDSVAAHIGLSPEYVSRLFKQETGINLVNYIQTERLQAACSMLMGSELSVSEIAARLGFDNFAYFSKLFRKHTGVSPSAYRKKE